MYQGTQIACPEFFAKHNHPIPKHYNPADWIMKIAQEYSHEQLISEGFCTSNNLNLPPDLLQKGMDLSNSLKAQAKSGISDDEWKHVSFCTEVQVLFARELKHSLRNKAGVGARFALTTFISLLVGCIFFQVGSSKDINSHFGSMVSAVILFHEDDLGCLLSALPL